MANKQQTTQENTIDQLNERLTNTGRTLEKNRKVIYWVLGIILGAGVLVGAYFYFFHIPGIEKSFKAYNDVEITAQGNDSIAAPAYAKVADNNSGAAANLAAIEAAEHYYNLGKNEEALKYIEKFSTSDKLLASSAQLLKGDCLVNLKKYDEAINAYNKALSECEENPDIAKRAMSKIALIYDEQKKYDKALEVYEKMATEYPDAMINALPVEAYIEREKARLGK